MKFIHPVFRATRLKAQFPAKAEFHLPARAGMEAAVRKLNILKVRAPIQRVRKKGRPKETVRLRGALEKGSNRSTAIRSSVCGKTGHDESEL